jgi:hypothetical protein
MLRHELASIFSDHPVYDTIGILVLAIIVIGFAAFLPDLIRYIHISRM